MAYIKQALAGIGALVIVWCIAWSSLLIASVIAGGSEGQVLEHLALYIASGPLEWITH